MLNVPVTDGMMSLISSGTSVFGRCHASSGRTEVMLMSRFNEWVYPMSQLWSWLDHIKVRGSY